MDGKFVYKNNFCFIHLFACSSPFRKGQFAVLYFIQVDIVLIQVYNCEIGDHPTVCRCGLAVIQYFCIL